MAVDAQGLFGSVVHDADPNPISALGLFASVVHDPIDAPSAGGDPPTWQGQSIQGADIQGQAIQPSRD